MNVVSLSSHSYLSKSRKVLLKTTTDCFLLTTILDTGIVIQLIKVSGYLLLFLISPIFIALLFLRLTKVTF